MEISKNDIDLIRRHTNYTSEEEIIEKIHDFSTPTKVISEYIRISTAPKKNTSYIIEPLSINQEIYRQIRQRMQLVKK